MVLEESIIHSAPSRSASSVAQYDPRPKAI
jgi:hypothetical protein